MRLIFPYAMRKLAERMMKKAQQSGGGTYSYTSGDPFGQQRSYRSQSTNQAEGKVRVDYVPPQEEKRKGAATAGEFVDFEEVK